MTSLCTRRFERTTVRNLNDLTDCTYALKGQFRDLTKRLKLAKISKWRERLQQDYSGCMQTTGLEKTHAAQFVTDEELFRLTGIDIYDGDH